MNRNYILFFFLISHIAVDDEELLLVFPGYHTKLENISWKIFHVECNKCSWLTSLNVSLCPLSALSDIKIKCFCIGDSKILKAFSCENSMTRGNISLWINIGLASFQRAIAHPRSEMIGQSDSPAAALVLLTPLSPGNCPTPPHPPWLDQTGKSPGNLRIKK